MITSVGIKFNEQELHKLNEGYKHIEPLKDRLNEDDYLAVNTFCKMEFIKKVRRGK